MTHSSNVQILMQGSGDHKKAEKHEESRETWRKQRNMTPPKEIEQHSLEQPGAQRRNWKGSQKKYFEINKSGNTKYQNLRDAAKAVLTRKFIVINAYLHQKKKDIK